MQSLEPLLLYCPVVTPRLERPLVRRGGWEETGDLKDPFWPRREERAEPRLFSVSARFCANCSARACSFFAAAFIAARRRSHPAHAIISLTFAHVLSPALCPSRPDGGWPVWLLAGEESWAWRKLSAW